MSLGWHFFHIGLVCCDRRRRLVSVVTLQIRCITARRDEVGQGATKGCRKKKEEKEKGGISVYRSSLFHVASKASSFLLLMLLLIESEKSTSSIRNGQLVVT